MRIQKARKRCAEEIITRVLTGLSCPQQASVMLEDSVLPAYSLDVRQVTLRPRDNGLQMTVIMNEDFTVQTGLVYRALELQGSVWMTWVL